MKKFCLLTFFLFALMKYGYSQDISSPPIKLEFLNPEFNILMDGGCSYYTYDSLTYESNNPNNTILAINNNSTAIIKIVGKNDNTYLKVVSKSHFTNNTDTSVYRSHGYTIKLNTHKVNKMGLFYYFYKGTMTVLHNNTFKTIAIHGRAFVPKKE